MSFSAMMPLVEVSNVYVITEEDGYYLEYNKIQNVIHSTSWVPKHFLRLRYNLEHTSLHVKFENKHQFWLATLRAAESNVNSYWSGDFTYPGDRLALLCTCAFITFLSDFVWLLFAT